MCFYIVFFIFLFSLYILLYASHVVNKRAILIVRTEKAHKTLCDVSGGDCRW